MLEQSFILLDGIGETREQRIWADGIRSWDQYRSADSVDGVGDSRKHDHDAFLEKASRNLELGNHAFFEYQLPDSALWRSIADFGDQAAFLDIETTGLDRHRNDITTVAVYDGEESRALVQGQDLTREHLEELLSDSRMLVTFNGKQFDLPFIRTAFPEIELDHIHIDLMFECRKVGLSGGLKSIEKEVGIGRGDVGGVDGSDAVRLWKQYQRRGDEDALQRLVEYNKKDVTNLEPLLHHVDEQLRRDILPS